MNNAEILHEELLTLDSHIDIPWPDRGDAWEDTQARQVDLPKLARGNMSAACLAAYIPQGARDETGHTAAWERVQAMLGVIGGLAGSRGGVTAEVCDTVVGIRAAYERRSVAIVPAVENGYPVGEDIGRITILRELGARYMTLTHNGHNLLADAAIARADLGDAATLHGGLSELGREAVREMNRQGMLVDVSHASRETMVQAVRESRSPVVATHSCARALCDHPRNLDDGQLDLLRESGGLIQITAMPGFLRRGGGAVGIDALVHHVAYVAERIGVAHVGVSSDFDGGGGIVGWRDASTSAAVTEGLAAHGFTTEEIGMIWGQNFLRLLEQAERLAG